MGLELSFVLLLYPVYTNQGFQISLFSESKEKWTGECLLGYVSSHASGMAVIYFSTETTDCTAMATVSEPHIPHCAHVLSK